MKICEQILKKDRSPIQFKFLNCKKLTPLVVQNDVMHAVHLNMNKRKKKNRFEVVLTSYGRNVKS